MNKADLFDLIRSKCASDREYIIELLKFRGFLIDKIGADYFISDNSHRDDADFLDETLKQNGVGYVADTDGFGRIIISNESSEKLKALFDENEGIMREMCFSSMRWTHFAKRKHGYKVPVRELEAFVARYVKALSAIGIFTSTSCDGNHPGKKEMYVAVKKSSEVWYSVICKRFLNEQFNIPWKDRSFFGIRLSGGCKYDAYYEVNNAAAYLYEHRIVLRNIKEKALEGYTNSYFNHHTDQEIETALEYSFNSLFDNVKI